jgi:hypothetical protein
MTYFSAGVISASTTFTSKILQSDPLLDYIENNRNVFDNMKSILSIIHNQ